MAVVADVSQHANDQQKIAPLLEQIDTLSEGLNSPAALLAYAGYYSADNIDGCCKAAIAPLIAVPRQRLAMQPHQGAARRGDLIVVVTNSEFQRDAARGLVERCDAPASGQALAEIGGPPITVFEFQQFTVGTDPVERDLAQPIPLQGPIDDDAGVMLDRRGIWFVIVDAMRIPDDRVVQEQRYRGSFVTAPANSSSGTATRARRERGPAGLDMRGS